MHAAFLKLSPAATRYIMTCIELYTGKNCLYHTENKGFSYLWLSKAHPPKPAEAEPSFRKVSL